jgi:hypothetical protein
VDVLIGKGAQIPATARQSKRKVRAGAQKRMLATFRNG